jgi:hypothetical protein
MTHTDRAFIAALQQSDARGVAPVALAVPRPPRPARQEGGVRAPLSRHLAQRRAVVVERESGPTPSVELDSFHWPVIAEQLAHAGRAGLVGLLSKVATSAESETPIVALVGARRGVGGSTLLLALARVSGGLGAPTAIVDLCDNGGAASLLGVRRANGYGLGDTAVASREDHALAIAAKRESTPAEVATLLTTLATGHELLLVDAGEPAEAARRLALAATLLPVQVLLVDAIPTDKTAIDAALRTLAAIGVAGVVETFAPLA